MASISLSTATSATHPGIRPMGFAQSLAYFGVPALGMVAGFHLVRPWLVSMGVQAFYAYGIGLGVPLALLWLVRSMLCCWCSTSWARNIGGAGISCRAKCWLLAR
ncbi:MAG: hypothetical protein HC853_11945 [Anaerolineae bacterium]|nr:hypothetical protein [Anaerolineae bacterium]